MSHEPVQQFTQEAAAYQRPPLLKDSFKALYPRVEALGARSVLDIGCANGDFLHFLPTGIDGTGIDVSSALIEQARSRNAGKPHLSFDTIDVLDAGAMQRLRDSFDLVTVVGTFHAFLDFRPLLDRVRELRPRWILIHSPLNEEPVDTRHFSRFSGDDGEYECAYSLHSRETIGRYLTQAGVRGFGFTLCEMERTLERDPQRPFWNYHVTIDGRHRYLTNGLGILFREYLIEIEC